MNVLTRGVDVNPLLLHVVGSSAQDALPVLVVKHSLIENVSLLSPFCIYLSGIMRIFHPIVCLLLLVGWTTKSLSQAEPFLSHAADTSIRSVRCHLEGLEFGLPVHTLNSQDHILFSFDDLDRNVQDYYYSIIHCQADWTPSDLPAMDYLEGFESNPLSRYDYSYATTQNYTHYEITIPNEDVRPTRSGNYVLIVYRYGEPENPLIVQRFYVVDRKVSIDGQVHQASRIALRQTHQEVDFTIEHKGFPINNPFQSITVAIMQNGREDNIKTDLKPTFVQGEKLVYDYSEETSFQAMKEFRWVDIQSLILLEERIKLFQIQHNKPHVYIAPDKIRSYDHYLYRKDINGHYFVNIREEKEIELASDYVYVHFTLPFRAPLNVGALYVMGDFNQWQRTPYNQMTYNFDRQVYEATLLLKQGYYNYLYGFEESPSSDVIDFDLVEGNYFETENDYTIFIYYRPFGARYDELIGVQTLNTLRN